jgi:hydroxyacylglutathione hydrolase
MKIYRVVVGPIQENCYIIKNEKTNEGIIVDPGDEGIKIMRTVREAGISKVTAIFITHGHGDHISALDEVKKATGAKVYMSRADAPMLRVWNSSLSYSVERDKNFDPPDAYFEDGETVTEAGMTFRIVATPGHTRGGVCIIGDGVVFCGDTVFLESIGRTDLPGGSYDDIINSIKNKLLPLPDDYTLLPGHGPETTIGWERRRNPFLQ